VVVDAERVATGKVARVTEATVTMVSVDASRRPIPFDSPVTLTDLSDAERE
jgi:acyl-CoA hydrolase